MNMDEFDKMMIIAIINDYMAQLITEGCPQEALQYVQKLKEKVAKIEVDKQLTPWYNKEKTKRSNEK